MLDSDASDQALGLVLQQKQDGMLKVIVYASQALHPAERSYCTTRKVAVRRLWSATFSTVLVGKTLRLPNGSRGTDISLSKSRAGETTGEIFRPVGRVRHGVCSLARSGTPE